MTRLSSWLVGTLLRRQTWPLEAFLAIQALCWGLWLLLPFRSFDVIPGAYTVLGLVPEPIWGVLFAGHGIAHLVVLWYRKVDPCRRTALVPTAITVGGPYIKIGDANRGRVSPRKGKKFGKHSPETRAKIGAALRGKKRKPLSPEHKAKLSVAAKRRKLDHFTDPVGHG